MKVENATHSDLVAVLAHMRDRDFDELSALYPAEDREQLVEQIAARWRAHIGNMLVARADEHPVCIGVTDNTIPNVVTLAFVATDEFGRVARPLTRWIKGTLFPRYHSAGVHRIQCASIAGYDQAHRWLESLGLVRESVVRKLGKDGQDFVQFAWVDG